MQIRTLTTFTDWTHGGGAWGRTGVRTILETLSKAGIRDVYWRVFNGGLAMYPSEIADVEGPEVYTRWRACAEYPFPMLLRDHLKEVDFNKYNPLPDAIEIAREYDVNLYWWYSIYEDEHGRPFRCSFNEEHPEYWQTDAEGRQYSGTFDWFYDEVREYKLKIIDELLQYPAQGLLLDLVRHNATPSSDADGVHKFGYNPEVRQAFKTEHGRDPMDLQPDDETWLEWKREIQTSLIREIRSRMRATGKFEELSLMLWPLNYRRWGCFDVDALTADGTVAMLAGSSLPYSFRPQEAEIQYNALRQQCRRQETKVLPALFGYRGIFGAQVEEFAESAAAAGADEIMFCEADHIAKWHLLTRVRAINLGISFEERRLQAQPTEAEDISEVDWSTIPIHQDFLFHSGNLSGGKPSEKTQVQIAYNSEALFFQFTCLDPDPKALLAPAEANPRQQFYLDALKTRVANFYLNAVNVFLDAQNSHQTFHIFAVQPNGSMTQASFVDEDWQADWTASVKVAEDRWMVYMSIPFAALKAAAPSPGDRWGANLTRGIQSHNEVSIWFPASWQQPHPNELGTIEFMKRQS